MDNAKIQPMFGKLIFSRIKYIDNQAELLSVPAAWWLIEQIQPQHILAVNSPASLYFALCQAAEKLDLGIKCSIFSDVFAADKAALHYHQQQYAELSEAVASVATAVQQAQLVLLSPQPEQQDLTTARLMDLNKAGKNTVVAVTGEQPLADAPTHFTSKLVLPHLIIYWQHGQQPQLDKLLKAPEQLSVLQPFLQSQSQTLTDRVLAAQSEQLQQALSQQQQITQYCQADNKQLQQQVTQQAVQIERQLAELAALANSQLLAEQASARMQQQHAEKEALFLQLSEQHQQLQQHNAELTQQLQVRTSELANLTIKLEQFNAQQYQLVQLQQTNSQLVAQTQALQANLSEQIALGQNRLEDAATELTALKEQLALDQQQYLQLAEQKQTLYTEHMQLQADITQLQTELNEKEKQNFLVQAQLCEAQLTLQQYQREAAQFTLMLQQQEQIRNAAAQRIQDLQQQIKNMQQLKTVKLAKVVAKLAHPFAKDQHQQQQLQHKMLVAASGWFDEQWYLTTYPDVANKQLDPILHYLKFGGFEGRNPHPNFDSQWYIQHYPDVAAQGINPLLHYIKFGQQEGRATRAGDTL